MQRSQERCADRCPSAAPSRAIGQTQGEILRPRSVPIRRSEPVLFDDCPSRDPLVLRPSAPHARQPNQTTERLTFRAIGASKDPRAQWPPQGGGQARNLWTDPTHVGRSADQSVQFDRAAGTDRAARSKLSCSTAAEWRARSRAARLTGTLCCMHTGEMPPRRTNEGLPSRPTRCSANGTKKENP